LKKIIYKADIIGATVSILCLIHCVITPIIFITYGAAACHTEAPLWWKSIDFLFLTISFLAIFRSTQTTSSQIIKLILWTIWTSLFFIIINEKLDWFHINENWLYFTAIILSITHIYNLKYCQCNNENCCINE